MHAKRSDPEKDQNLTFPEFLRNHKSREIHLSKSTHLIETTPFQRFDMKARKQRSKEGKRPIKVVMLVGGSKRLAALFWCPSPFLQQVIAHKGVQLLRPENCGWKWLNMLQKPVFALPGCQRISVNTLLCDTLGLADWLASQSAA